jgi:hypothetical protein
MPGRLRVGRVAFVLLAGSVVGLALTAASGRASLYSPDTPRFVIPVGADGKPQALPLDDFRGVLAILMNARDERKVDDRKPFLDRIERTRGKKLSPPETAALAADLLHIGRMDEALNELNSLLRQENLQNDVSVSMRERGLIISINSVILFPRGSAELTNDARVLVEKISNLLTPLRANQICVEGHTDNDPINT